MTSARSRQQKRRSSTTRKPGVWRGALPQTKPDGERTRQVERSEHGIRDEITVSWRLLSGGIVVCLGLVMAVFLLTDLFIVSGIRLEGQDYLNESEVFRYADIAGKHLFWIDPDDVRENILNATPLIADAQVRMGWPPNMVTIRVQERQPSLIWIQDNVRLLVDVQGSVLRSPRDEEQFPELIVIEAEGYDQPRLPSEPIPLDVVSGALQLQRTISGLQTLRYNATKGLGFREQGATWEVWLGTGTDMPNKLTVYRALRDNLLTRGVAFIEIDVSDLEGVYYRTQ